MGKGIALVTGATGFIGSHLLKYLINEGFIIKIFIRKSSNLRWIKNLNVQKILVDYNNLNKIKDEIRDVNYIFHLASIVRANNYRTFLNVNYIYTRNILNLCAGYCKEIKLFCYLSSQSAA